MKGAEKEASKETEQIAEVVKTIKSQIAELEEKQRRFGAQSAKTRAEMSKVMKDEAYALLDKIAKTDEVLQTLYLKTPFEEQSWSVSTSGDHGDLKGSKRRKDSRLC